MYAEQSIEQVVKTYTATVYGVALTHTASRADADDVFQEVFVAYWRSKPKVSSEEHRKAWLIRTTLNFCLKATQSSWAKKTVYTDGQGDVGESGLSNIGEAGSQTAGLPVAGLPGATLPTAELLTADYPFQTKQQSELYEALRALPTAYRTAVTLFYFEDMSVAQMSTVLGDEQGAIKTRLSRARAQLREMLKRGAKDD